jgi:hypothetical protein
VGDSDVATHDLRWGQKHRICCLEPIAYVGELVVAFMCPCGRLWHLSDYYGIERGINWTMEYGPHVTVIRGI